MRNVVIAVVVAAVAASAGYLGYRRMASDDLAATAALDLGRLRLPDQHGKDQDFEQWRAKILIVNFWATWCEPCREEVPDLIKIQAKYASKSVQVVGIALDSANKVREFANEFRIGYPLLIGNMQVMDIARRMGNVQGGLPYTVVMDAAGKVVTTRLGRISDAQLEAAVRLAGG